MSQGWYTLKLKRKTHGSVMLFLYPFHGHTYYLKWGPAEYPTAFLGQSLKLIDNVQELHALDNMLDDNDFENAYECQVTKKKNGPSVFGEAWDISQGVLGFFNDLVLRNRLCGGFSESLGRASLGVFLFKFLYKVKGCKDEDAGVCLTVYQIYKR